MRNLLFVIVHISLQIDNARMYVHFITYFNFNIFGEYYWMEGMLYIKLRHKTLYMLLLIVRFTGDIVSNVVRTVDIYLSSHFMYARKHQFENLITMIPSFSWEICSLFSFKQLTNKYCIYLFNYYLKHFNTLTLTLFVISTQLTSCLTFGATYHVLGKNTI
jgi:hypothetical protein